jgi:hypothetical protein
MNTNQQMEEAKRLGDKTQKPYRITGEKIQDLAKEFGACLATDRILIDGCPVGYMYREEPDFEQDGGWRFFAGDETEEYLDDQWNSGIYDVNTIANYDPEIIPYLNSNIGSDFERTNDGFRKVEE